LTYYTAKYGLHFDLELSPIFVPATAGAIRWRPRSPPLKARTANVYLENTFYSLHKFCCYCYC